MPFEPLVFTSGFIPSVSSASRTISAHSRTWSNVAPSPGVEVEVHVVGPVDVVALRVPLVQVDAPEIDHPQQRRHVVDHREVDDVPVAVIDRAGADPVRPRRRRALHEEERPGGAVRISLHHHRAVADVREQDGRDVGVVLDQAALRDPALRPERLAQVGQAHLLAGDGQRRVIDVGGNLDARRVAAFANRVRALAGAGRVASRPSRERTRARGRP